MTHIENHIARVEGWAEARGLYDTVSPMVQFWKMMEEVAELGMADAKESFDDVKDAIGDIRVCLINFCAIGNIPFTQRHDPNHEITDKLLWLLLQESADIQRHMFNGSVCPSVMEFNRILSEFAAVYGFTLEECDDHAWEQIKDRKGKTVNGEFIKEQA